VNAVASSVIAVVVLLCGERRIQTMSELAVCPNKEGGGKEEYSPGIPPLF
jgi:hypothetical protein